MADRQCFRREDSDAGQVSRKPHLCRRADSRIVFSLIQRASPVQKLSGIRKAEIIRLDRVCSAGFSRAGAVRPVLIGTAGFFPCLVGLLCSARNEGNIIIALIPQNNAAYRGQRQKQSGTALQYSSKVKHDKVPFSWIQTGNMCLKESAGIPNSGSESVRCAAAPFALTYGISRG